MPQPRRSTQSTRSSRPPDPTVSSTGRQALAEDAAYLQSEEDLSTATVRNYLSDLRHFASWCEHTWEEGQEVGEPFTPAGVATPTITRYRSYLQTVLGLKRLPLSIAPLPATLLAW
ncbi:MAG TPA: site-specific integrase [Chloroflexia bacterium]|nr:site-specific integrase [Chloroflexia bacterium]